MEVVQCLLVLRPCLAVVALLFADRGGAVEQCWACSGQWGQLIDLNRPCDDSTLQPRNCSSTHSSCIYSREPIAKALIRAVDDAATFLESSRPFFHPADALDCVLDAIDNVKWLLVRQSKPQCKQLAAFLESQRPLDEQTSGVFTCDSAEWQFCEAGINFQKWIFSVANLQHCFDTVRPTIPAQTATTTAKTSALINSTSDEQPSNHLRRRRQVRAQVLEEECTDDADDDDQRASSRRNRKIPMSTTTETTSTTSTTTTTTTTTTVTTTPSHTSTHSFNALDVLRQNGLLSADNSSCTSERPCITAILSKVEIPLGHFYCCSWNKCNRASVPRVFVSAQRADDEDSSHSGSASINVNLPTCCYYYYLLLLPLFQLTGAKLLFA